jgi:Family of unknown function (DUF5683)
VRAFFILFLLFASWSVSAQINDESGTPKGTVVDSTNYRPITNSPKPVLAKNDTFSIKKHSPTKATVLSLVLPGAGQVYNRKNWWWKVPIIYGGGAALVYGAVFYQQNYKDYQEAYLFKVQNPTTEIGDPKFDQLQTPTLKNYRDSYKQSRDQCLVGLALLYTVQVLDACVEAHFFDFNVSEDLSLNVQPQFGFYGTSTYSGVQLTLSLR